MLTRVMHFDASNAEVRSFAFCDDPLDASAMLEAHVAEATHVTPEHVLERCAPAPKMKKVVVILLCDVAVGYAGRQDFVDARPFDADALELREKVRMSVAKDRLQAREEDVRVAKLWNAGAVPLVEGRARVDIGRRGVALQDQNIVATALESQGRGKATHTAADDDDPGARHRV